jgi:hypothetical protein
MGRILAPFGLGVLPTLAFSSVSWRFVFLQDMILRLVHSSEQESVLVGAGESTHFLE